MNGRTLVLDFDGTVCVGDGPVLLYAEEVARRTGRDVTDELRHFLRTGRLPAGDVRSPGSPSEPAPTADAMPLPEDGYQAVVALALATGRGGPQLDRDMLGAAYRASRARFAQDGAGTAAPDGLRAFLARLTASGVRVVLVTNSPLVGVSDWLERQGIAPLLDGVVPEAGKPAAMAAVLRGLLSGADPGELVSVGDVHANDVAPALAVGAAGAHIDRWTARPGPATWSAPSFTELFEPLAAWSVGEKISVESIM
ncbi:HAD family hydrolase [Myceligenerans indicum]|uniref:HAD family hydrolase n=1 Tax=Myceligenerans indicum TaxID=2593663 RepID=A0ABS1LFY9_9MICO|nr:haloacid dehalogenase-like hydrolase [Myceligenerans indicum]MBL0885116.1 HAD family hydrolase [Myceligenerans indicum]